MTAQAIIEDLTARGVRIWAEGDRLKIDAPVGILNDDDIAKLAEHKPDLLVALAQSGICPRCALSATLQQREPLVFWCPGCRIFSDQVGRQIFQQATPKPLTLEVNDARQLLEDLHAAGCVITARSDEIAITNLGRLSQELWERLEQAGPEFIQAVRGLAEAFKEHNDWLN